MAVQEIYITKEEAKRAAVEHSYIDPLTGLHEVEYVPPASLLGPLLTRSRIESFHHLHCLVSCRDSEMTKV